MKVETHSAALITAARSDRDRLQEVRHELHLRHTALSEEIQQLNSSIAEIQTAIRRLGEIIGDELQMPLVKPDAVAPQAISGADVRRVAVAVGLQHVRSELPWHYMEWFAAVSNAGYRIKGADPQAVFLTQLSRSPLTAKCAESGCYRLDRHAVTSLADHVTRLTASRDELLSVVHRDGQIDIDSLADQLQEVTRELARNQRLLGEGLSTARDLDSDGWFEMPSVTLADTSRLLEPTLA